MSLEDVRSLSTLGSQTGIDQTQDPHQDQNRSQDHDQDGIVLDRIASLSVDMFVPSDFKGRFSKIQSRKRTRIIRGRF